MKTNIDVFYFNVNCFVHNLINFAQEISKEEFKGFWEKIGKKNEFNFDIDSSSLYGGFTQQGGELVDKLIEGLAANGFAN